MTEYQKIIESVLTPVGKSGNDIIYLCPKCNDKSGHLYIDYNKGYYHCVRCHQLRGKRLNKLVKELNLSTDFDYDIIEDSEYSKKLDEIINYSEESVQVVDYSTNLNHLTRYYQYHIKDLSQEARNYLYSRGINDYYIDMYQIKEGTNQYGTSITLGDTVYKGRNYSNRIIIPSLRKDGLISFYVARDYTGRLEPRYLNPPKELAYSSEDVWNLDIIQSDEVVICEGVFTALAVNIVAGFPIAVATYGKSISNKSNSDNKLFKVTSQGNKLLNKRFRTYYVFYDKDAKDEAFSTMEYLSDRGANVKYVSIDTDKYGPKADAANLTSEELIYCMRNAKDFDKFLYLDL